MRGSVYPWHGRKVIPTFHPAAILHGGGEKSRQFGELQEDFALIKRTLAEPDPPAPPAPPRRPCVDSRAERETQPAAATTSWSCSDGGARRSATPTADDTRDAGAALGRLLRPHDVVVLTGELGAGKTTFVQGVAARARRDRARRLADVHARARVRERPRAARARRPVPARARAGRDRPRAGRARGRRAGPARRVGRSGRGVCSPTTGSAIEFVGRDPTGADETRRITVEAIGAVLGRARRRDRAALDGGRA